MTVAGTPLLLTMTFDDVEDDGALVIGEPTAVTLVLQPKVGSPIVVPQSEMTHVAGTNLYTYRFDTTDLPGDYVAQAQGVGALLAVTDPEYFTVDPVVVTGLV